MLLRKSTLAAVGLLVSIAAAMPAQANMTFAFDFTAPLTNGDTASGFGTVRTEDADAAGHYRFLSAKGSFYGYAGQDPARDIVDAWGIDSAFNFSDGFVYQDTSGAFVTDGVFFLVDGFGGIGMWPGASSLYDGFYSEVGVKGATLSFAPSATAVPEPASWAMMLLGFGTLGVAVRRLQSVRVRFA